MSGKFLRLAEAPMTLTEELDRITRELAVCERNYAHAAYQYLSGTEPTRRYVDDQRAKVEELKRNIALVNKALEWCEIDGADECEISAASGNL